MANFFVAGVERVVQLLVSLRRLENFFLLSDARQAFTHGTDGSKINGNGNSHSSKFAVEIVDTDVFYEEEDEVKLDKGGKVKKSATDVEADSKMSVEKVGGEKSLHASSHKRKYILKQLDLHVEKGELVGVFGGVGSGKSTLLAAILGEARTSNSISGEPVNISSIDGTCAYCSQVPWIMEGTIRDNICFLQEFDAGWYKQVRRNKPAIIVLQCF